MPTINDATVVASAYDTSGNGGRKLVRLSNGWIVSVTKQTDQYDFYVDKRDGGGFIPLCYINQVNINSGEGLDISIVAKGTMIHAIANNVGNAIVYHVKFDATTVTNTNVLTGSNYVALDTQNSLQNNSLTINDTGTELHATWSSKNATYPSSFNIRYAKGTINADGSVTWGAVSYPRTTPRNTVGVDDKNPSIILDKNGYPIITFDTISGGNYYIDAFVYNGSSWAEKVIYNGSTYAQSSPSAIFVPQSVNGLANGRIWVAWHGADSTDTVNNIRVAYSDDNGVTWSTQKLTTGNSFNRKNTSITANKNNEIHITFEDNSVAGSWWNLRKIKNSSGSWGSVVNITNSTTGSNMNSSTLFDLSVNFTEPLFIYQSVVSSKVGFYGTWTVTTISVTQGSIGAKSDRTNVLTYTITTDGTMGTITEKVNGTTIATKNIASGVQTALGLTQAQWDAVRYGKYDNKNLIPPFQSWNKTDIANTYVTIVSDYSLRLTTTSAGQAFRSDYVPVLENTQYTLSGQHNGMVNIYYYDSNKATISNLGNSASQTITFTTPPNTSYVIIRFSNDTLTAVGTYTFTNPQLEKGSLASPFMPYFGNNTLTVEMGSEKWTYTFDKRLATSDDVLSAVKAVQDTNNVYLPSVKAKLASSIRAKGGTVNDTDSFDTMVSAISGMTNKKWASGTTTSMGTTRNFVNDAGSTVVSNHVIVTGLSFQPSVIVLFDSNGFPTTNVNTRANKYNGYIMITKVSGTTATYYRLDTTNAYINGTGFQLPFSTQSAYVYWEAFE